MELVKNGRKFVHYKKDLLKPDRLAEIESRLSDLKSAIAAKNIPQTEAASKQLRAVCEHALPYEKPQGAFEENLEVLFVAVVIALGLRAYYLQPFRIPTGSMQPTLNGIIGTPLAKEQWPSLPTRIAEKILRGRTYVHVVNDQDRHIAFDPKGRPAIVDAQWLRFFSRSQIFFTDSKPLRLPAPSSQAYQIGLADAVRAAIREGGLIKKGTVLCEGTVDSGDLVLVNKFSYHFRKPNRGEVFVFDTLGIRGIHDRSGEQADGAHYIKRLCGVPGDTISIQPPYLMVNGKIAKEPGIERVMKAEGPYAINPRGYLLADPAEAHRGDQILTQYLTKPGSSLTLSANTAPGLREYAALGDNSPNSLDSRFWGTVKEYNLVGPALFSLWPVTTGHWGFIR